MSTLSGAGHRADGPGPLRLLVIDKTTILKNNRERFRRLADLADIDLTLLAPTRWVENCVMEPYQPVAGEPYRTILGRVSWPGKEIRAIFLNGIIRAFRRSRPQVILMMEESFSLFALQVVLLRRILAPAAPLIFYSNNIVSYRRFDYRPGRLVLAINNYVMRRCAVGLCVNRKAVDVMRDSIFRGDIRELFYGINERLFQPVPKARARAAIGMPVSAELFLYAGRLFERKGVDDLIDAFTRLRAERPGADLRLLILGDGDYRDQLIAKAESLDLGRSVEFRRAVPIEEMADHIGAATAFVLPSRAEWCEQFGRVNAEAMLVETTIIGSTSGEIPRVVGDGGYIFPAGDIDALKRTMAEVIDNPEEAARRRAIGRERAMRLYSVQGYVDGAITLLEDLSGRALRRGEGR
ncbi:MAG: glycosyltransferase family 4 protein [Bacteroidota bacterium]